jgi:predicted kinase
MSSANCRLCSLLFLLSILLSRTPYSASMYNYSRSTEANHASDRPIIAGSYARHRAGLDYTHHGYYDTTRQSFQDNLIALLLSRALANGASGAASRPPALADQWIVYSAGVMGSGKSHTLDWLQAQNAFPLRDFVCVDPDHIRDMLPEFSSYAALDPSTAGELTQKEAGHISEIAVLRALELGHSVMVDGSLRDHVWYAEYFSKLRAMHPNLKVAIIEVTASLETCQRRAQRRSCKTGRTVPARLIEEAFANIPESVGRLKPLANFTCTISNEYDNAAPEIVAISEGSLCLDGFRSVWKHRPPVGPPLHDGSAASSRGKLVIKRRPGQGQGQGQGEGSPTAVNDNVVIEPTEVCTA